MSTLIAKAKMLKGRLQNLSLKWRRRMNWFDISQKIDTSDCVDKELLYDSIASDNKQHMVRYVPTHFRQLNTVFDQLMILDPALWGATFVDFGCGKGRVLIMAHQRGFKNVAGVEFSKKLYEVCLTNLNRVRVSYVRVTCEDAVHFPLCADMRTFYFCNPFEFCVLEKVLSNIRDCLRNSGKIGYIVYVDPRKFGQLDPKGYALMFNYPGPGTPFHIYKVLV